jgi:ComF family protein
LTTAVPPSVRVAVQKLSFGLFNLIFPDNCRLCEIPLTKVSRIPVCDSCLKKPQPLDAEFFCVACRAPFVNEYPLDESGRCSLCRLGLSGYDAAYSFGFYQDELRGLIQLFKYGKVQTLAGPLAQMLSRALPRDRAFELIVPMPMHWRRRWERGFNQADLLAREAGRRTGVPVKSVVKRSKATPPQAGLTSAKRRANVSGAFEVPKPELVKGKRILLVDDVLTTGATAAACARSLKRAGAVSVTVWTVARADRRVVSETATMAVTEVAFTQPSGSLTDGKSGSLA